MREKGMVPWGSNGDLGGQEPLGMGRLRGKESRRDT